MLLTPEQRIRAATNRLQALERKRLRDEAVAVRSDADSPHVGKRQRSQPSFMPGGAFQSDSGTGHQCTVSCELDGFLEAGVIAMQDDVHRQRCHEIISPCQGMRRWAR